MKIDKVWEALRTDDARSRGLVRRRIVPQAPVDIFAAVEHPENIPLLQVETAASAIPLDFRPPEASGFSVTLVGSGKARVQVQLRLEEASGESVFRAFVDDVMRSVETARTEVDAFNALMSCIHIWQEFFRKHGFSGLSPGAQQGLFGELWFMRTMLVPEVGVPASVSMWVGPSGADQDFDSNGTAYEVKTSTANPLRTVRVSNLRQLDDRCLSRLHVVLVEAERHQAAEGNLPDGVSRMRELVRSEAPHLLDHFNQLLREYGYLDRDAHRYESISYEIRHARVFSVSEGFPRLTEDTVPQGIGGVTYSIALEALLAYESDWQDSRPEPSGDEHDDSE